MCGIYGIFNFDGRPVNEKDLSLMGRLMLHRGPDGEGHFIKGAVGIGMRRLSIIDLSGGNQPISNEDGSIHIVLNGEIYNYIELRKELIQRGHQFKTQSDVECVLHLYEEIGTACLERLNGMFSIALYDDNKKSLWLARDRLGIKPLFYHHTTNALIFASDLNSLKSISGGDISKSAVLKYIGISYIPEPDSIYQGIKKLGRGEHIFIANGQVKPERYWQVRTATTFEGDLVEAAETLEELMLDSSKLQLQSDVPLGFFLSGGVDSCAVAAFAAANNGVDNMHTYTIDFTNKGGDDVKFSQMFAEHIGAKHHVISADTSQLNDALDQLLAVMDEPLSDNAILPTFLLSKFAAEHGVKVILSGAGGDEIFGGYGRHFPKKFFSAAWIAASPLARLIFCRLTRSTRPHLARRLSSPANNFGVSISGANLEFLRDVLHEEASFNSILDNYRGSFNAAYSDVSLNLMHLDLQHYLPNNVLALTDKATMAASVEGRLPLLDHRLVEFAFSLPSNMNPLAGKDKGLFKHVLAKYVPREILSRSKEGFNAPVNEWVENNINKIRNELLGNSALFLKEMFDFKSVELWLDSPEKRRFSGDTLYSMYLLNRWIRIHTLFLEKGNMYCVKDFCCVPNF